MRFGEDFAVHVKVGSPASDDVSGDVEIREAGEVIARGTLRQGRVQIMVREDLAMGRHELVAAYLGNDTTEPSEDSFTVTVRR